MNAALPLLLFGIFAIGCDDVGLPISSAGPDPEHPQTEVLRIDIDPNPVTAGDTTLITVHIRDSLDTRFKYTWVVSSVGRVVGGPDRGLPVTDSNSVFIVSNAASGRHSGTVFIDNGMETQGFLPVSESFDIIVE